MRNIVLRSTICHKIISIIMAFATWNILQHSIILTRVYSVPICFYTNNDAHTIISMPDTIQVTLQGPKSAWQKIDMDALALHINGDICSAVDQNQWFSVADGSLFVPNGISVIHYNPTHILVHPKTV